jgi:hypothetical protein
LPHLSEFYSIFLDFQIYFFQTKLVIDSTGALVANFKTDALLHSLDADNITVVGGGKIDGQHPLYIDYYQPYPDDR